MIFIKKIFKHKLITGIILILIIAGGYFGYQKLTKNKSTTQYVTAVVEKGTLIISVSGSGQVSVSDQMDIKPKVSGEVTRIDIKNGQEVKAGALLAQIDTRAAEKTLRDAKTALETAKLELEELLSPPDEYTLMQAENSLTQAKETLEKLKFTQETNYQAAIAAKEKAEDNLEKSYEDTFNKVADVFLDLPTIITGVRDVLYSYEIDNNEITITNLANISALENSISVTDSESRTEFKKLSNIAENNYKDAKAKYDENFKNYKSTSRYSEKTVIETLLDETLETTKAIAETVKSENNMIDFWVDYRSSHSLRIFSTVTQYQSSLKSYTSTTNSHLSSLLSYQRSIKDYKEAKSDAEQDILEMDRNRPIDLAASERSIKEKEKSLAKLKAGADELDIRAKKISIQQKEDVLSDAQQSLTDHYIRAPFEGVVSGVNVKKGDSVSSGTALTSIVTRQKIIEITLNEVDIIKVKAGQKATITFDAIEDFSITGEVADIDVVGTVSQGVVTYNVKIAFDTQDDRVKSGMSVSASIITDVKQDILLAQNSAVKSQGDARYVEVMADNNATRRQTVEIGLSNDTMTEITSGLQEGEKIVVRTSSTTTSNNSSGTQNRQSQQGPGGGGEIFRILR